MSISHITLIIPGLFESLSKASQTMPRVEALETILAKSDRSSYKASSLHECLLPQFDIELKTAGCIAAVSRYADSAKRDEKIWLQLTPVFLNADKDRLMLQGQSMLSITQTEADSMVAELNNCYKDDGWQFETYHPERWYVSLPELPAVDFFGYFDALGRSVEPFMPSGKDHIEWRRVINEMQMVLHATDVNQNREASSRHPINSVWCWGIGELPVAVKSAWRHVYTNDAFCKGLVMLSDGTASDLSDDASLWLKNIQSADGQAESHDLIVMQQSEEDILSLDVEHYTQRLAELEDRWFNPILKSLKRGQISSVTLITGNGHRYCLQKKHLRRFWKRCKPVSLLSSSTS